MVAVLEPPSPPPDVDALVAALAAAVDDVVAVHAPDLCVSERAGLLGGVWREADRLQVELAVLSRVADLAGDWTEVGATSCTTWLSQLVRASGADVKERLRVGGALAQLPRVRAAGTGGEVSWEAVRILASTVAGGTSELARRDEEVLLEQAVRLRIRDLAAAVRHWKALAAAETGGPPPDPRERRSLRLARASDGFGVGSMVLDPEAASIVGRALEGVAGPRRNGDARSGPRRLADALVELCDAFLKGEVPGGRGAVAGLVLVPVEHLPTEPETGAARRHDDPPPGPGRGFGPSVRLVDGTPVDHEWLRRLACNSPFARAVLGADGLPLDVGREQRFATPAIWRALVLRDGGCSHPWCDRPPGWCEAHHVDGVWEAGRSTTAVEHMTLACARHHHLVHEGGWSVRIEHGRPVWTDPRGEPVRPP
jgi:hypothetical protein